MVRLASRLLTASSVPLIGAIAIDLFLIGKLVGAGPDAGLIAATTVLVPAALFWYAMPHSVALRERLRR